ncbi:MobA/MobL family protein [Escherichia coli]
MAIYHLSMKIISRSSGYSAVASAAYRSGSLMLDERTGLTHDYTRKSGVAEAVILTLATAPCSWYEPCRTLGMPLRRPNAGRTSQLRGEIELAIPHELPQDAARETVLAFVRENFVSQGMIADVAFHHMDKTNPHAHIMLDHEGYRTCWVQRKGYRDWNDRHSETAAIMG